MTAAGKAFGESQDYEFAFRLQVEETLFASKQTDAPPQNGSDVHEEIEIQIENSAKHGTSSCPKRALAADSEAKSLQSASAKRQCKRNEAAIPVPDTSPEDDEVQSLEMCAICMGWVTTQQVHSVRACFHRFCAVCLDSYIAEQAKSKKFPVSCPSPECTAKISLSEAGRLLSSQAAMDALRAMEVEACLPDDEKFYCPHASCSVLMTLPSNVEHGNGNAECPACHKMVCMRCKTVWHDGLSCKQFQKLPAEMRSKEDQQLLLLASKRNWQQCSKCQRMIERKDGCRHMTCVCGHEFCYRCGSPWTRGYCPQCAP